MEEDVLILARSNVKRKIVEHLMRGGKTPSELAALLTTKLPNITSALKDLTHHFMIYQANPESTKGKLYLLTERGYNALSILENKTTEELVTHYASQPSNYRGRVIRSSAMQMKCVFNSSVLQWDFVSGQLRGLMGTYTIIGIIKELQILPTVHSEGNNRTPERTSSTCVANVILLGTLLDGDITSQTYLLPVGNPVDIASEEDVKQVLGLSRYLAKDNSKTISFGRTLGKPHFPVALSSHPVNNILVGDIPRRTQIAVVTQIIKDILSKSDSFERRGIIFCFTRNPEEFMHLSNRVITEEQEFQAAPLDSLFREHEESKSGIFLIVDFSSISKPADYYRAYDTVVGRRHMLMTIGQLVAFLEDLYSKEQKKLPKDTYFVGPAVSIVIDEVDQFLLGEENIRIFENIVEAGRGYFDHRILITQSPFQSTKNLRTTSTLLLGSDSIRRLDILDLEQWGHQHILFREIMEIPTLLAESDYMLINSYLDFPVLLTISDQLDVSEKRAESKEQLYLLAKKVMLKANKNVVIEGATMKHKFDFSFKKNEKIFLVQYKKLDRKKSMDQITHAREWIFPTVDINRAYGKFVLVYEGDLDPESAKILQHYYNVVVPVHKFDEFLQKGC